MTGHSRCLERDRQHLTAMAEMYLPHESESELCRLALGHPGNFAELSSPQSRRVQTYIQRQADNQVQHLNAQTDARLLFQTEAETAAEGRRWLD